MAEEAGPVVNVSTGEGELHQVCDIDAEGRGESNADAAVRCMKLGHGGGQSHGTKANTSWLTCHPNAATE